MDLNPRKKTHLVEPNELFSGITQSRVHSKMGVTFSGPVHPDEDNGDGGDLHG
jgi:hypothetical protein